jgi:hypothetical protein
VNTPRRWNAFIAGSVTLVSPPQGLASSAAMTKARFRLRAASGSARPSLGPRELPHTPPSQSLTFAITVVTYILTLRPHSAQKFFINHGASPTGSQQQQRQFQLPTVVCRPRFRHGYFVYRWRRNGICPHAVHPFPCCWCWVRVTQ